MRSLPLRRQCECHGTGSQASGTPPFTILRGQRQWRTTAVLRGKVGGGSCELGGQGRPRRENALGGLTAVSHVGFGIIQRLFVAAFSQNVPI